MLYKLLICSFRCWLTEKRRREYMGKKPRLWCALFQCFKWQIIFHGFLYVVEVREAVALIPNLLCVL